MRKSSDRHRDVGLLTIKLSSIIDQGDRGAKANSFSHRCETQTAAEIDQIDREVRK